MDERSGRPYEDATGLRPTRHPHMRRAVPLLAAALAIAATVPLAAPLAAQRAGQAQLRGTVVDADSKAPLLGAFVALADARRGALTDSLGRFILPVERAERYPLRVTQLGYKPLEVTMPAEAESRTFMVGMKPDPIELEGLVVLSRRLTERAAGRFGTPRVLEQGDLVGTSFGTLAELTRDVVPFAQPCSPDADSLCVSGQGRLRPLQICLDGRRVSSASPELEAIDPRSLYLVASYPRVGRIDMFSRAFVGRLLEMGQDLPPATFECVDPGGFPGG